MGRTWAAGGPKAFARPEPVMTLPRSAADVLNEHVVFEVECIDRMYLNVYQALLQHELGLIGFLRSRLGCTVTSTAPLAKISDTFTASIRAFITAEQVPLVHFSPGQRKDDVMHEYLAAFEATARTEGVVFVGRAQEKNRVFRTEKRRDQEGKTYPWIVKTTGIINQWYFYCVDEDFGPFFLKFSSYFPYTGKLYLLTELPEGSLQLSRRIGVSLGTVPTHDRFRETVSGSAGDGGSPVGGAEAWWGSVRAVSAA
jgi:hypothetical protein